MAGESPSEIGLYKRWLCYDDEGIEKFVPMAVYLPSSFVGKNKTKSYFISDSNGGGDYGNLRKKYYKDSSDFFRRASIVLGPECDNEKSLKSALSEMLEECKSSLSRMDESVRESAESGILEIEAIGKEYAHMNNVKAMTDDFLSKGAHDRWEVAEFLDRLLNLTLRYKMYWLAVHYNECAWIRELNQQKENGGLRKVYKKFFFDEIRFICPCIVSTFFMTPRLFEFKNKDGDLTYNYGLADLLIVDEAGQVSPEIGLPAFALAKKAIVVGDIKQIPPVYGIPEKSNELYWEKYLGNQMPEEQKKTLSCVSSSIMAIAEKRCPFQRKTPLGAVKGGLFLNEHRRCVDEIIDYSNELIYDGELKPMRGKAKDKCKLNTLPAMGICVSESGSKTLNGSRYNEKEIEKIKDFIKSNKNDILKAYNKDKEADLKDLICIITPFKAQSNRIRNDEYLKQFHSGTVHTFQGAESPIVIFSLVYGPTDYPTFIMNNHQLMNVAVSRAKDHFIVAGSRACLKKYRKDDACGLLYDKLEVIKTSRIQLNGESLEKKH